MTAIPATQLQADLARQSGSTLFTGPQAILKGVLEAEVPVELIAGPAAGGFCGLFESTRDEAAASLLGLHGTELIETRSSARAAALAIHAAQSGRRALALVPNDQLDAAFAAMAGVRDARLADGGVCLVLEDDPPGSPASCPRRAAARLGVPCLEPDGVAGLRDAVEQALRLGRAGGGATCLVVHHAILRSAETFEARPNRVLDPVQEAAARSHRRGPRWAEAGGVLRMARRLELNQTHSQPSPGERVPVGFIVVGVARAALDHVIHVLGLHNRVPVLRLGVLNPLDESVVERIVGRCQRVVLLEPRPGSTEPAILRVANGLRARNEHAAELLVHSMGSDPAGRIAVMRPDDAAHPSLLARRIVHLLHPIRPGLDVAKALAPDPPALGETPPARGEALGFTGARALVRGALADVDQWLRDRMALEGPNQPETALAVEGVSLPGAPQRVVPVEIWPQESFAAEGIHALRQAARDERPWVFIVCALDAAAAQDVERLARGAVPGPQADRARIERVDLHDRIAVRDLLRDLALYDGLGVVVAADGPPPRFDVAGLERACAEIDRLGYEPRQRVVRSAEEACAIRQAGGPRPARWTEPRGAPLETQLAVGRPSAALRGTIRLRVRPLLEQVEVVRERPPAAVGARGAGGRPPIPRPLHASKSQWRAHLAGFRGAEPGVCAWVLSQAGLAMGYNVRTLHDPAPIGPGRRAWAQVLFTQPRRDHSAVPVTGRVPYGEADLLLGLDADECLRAVDPQGELRVAGPDRTHTVANLGGFAGHEAARVGPHEHDPVATALRAVSRVEKLLVADFTTPCRGAFRTDRVADLVLLGAAYQRGLVPLSLEAIEGAMERVEQRGIGRAREAFLFGRRLAEDPRLFARPGGEQEDVGRAVRRARLEARRGGPRRDERLRFAGLMQRCVSAMPGLAETDPGRVAQQDFVVALRRCQSWGGFAYARRYAELITSLYRADRGQQGRALTRSAILPLAEAMLIRDLVYVATVATSREERRRLRRTLNVKMARGDRVERRFLTRLELIAWQRRYRLDVRTGDWPAYVLRAVRRLVPQNWRGSARERQIRQRVMDLADRAVHGTESDYARHAECLHRLHEQARDERLRQMAVSELQMLIGEG